MYNEFRYLDSPLGVGQLIAAPQVVYLQDSVILLYRSWQYNDALAMKVYYQGDTNEVLMQATGANGAVQMNIAPWFRKHEVMNATLFFDVHLYHEGEEIEMYTVGFTIQRGKTLPHRTHNAEGTIYRETGAVYSFTPQVGGLLTNPDGSTVMCDAGCIVYANSECGGTATFQLLPPINLPVAVPYTYGDYITVKLVGDEEWAGDDSTPYISLRYAGGFGNRWDVVDTNASGWAGDLIYDNNDLLRLLHTDWTNYMKTGGGNNFPTFTTSAHIPTQTFTAKRIELWIDQDQRISFQSFYCEATGKRYYLAGIAYTQYYHDVILEDADSGIIHYARATYSNVAPLTLYNVYSNPFIILGSHLVTMLWQDTHIFPALDWISFTHIVIQGTADGQVFPDICFMPTLGGQWLIVSDGSPQVGNGYADPGFSPYDYNWWDGYVVDVGGTMYTLTRYHVRAHVTPIQHNGFYYDGTSAILPLTFAATGGSYSLSYAWLAQDIGEGFSLSRIGVAMEIDGDYGGPQAYLEYCLRENYAKLIWADNAYVWRNVDMYDEGTMHDDSGTTFFLRGTMEEGIEEVTEWPIEIISRCSHGEGMWLVYLNSDGAERILWGQFAGYRTTAEAGSIGNSWFRGAGWTDPSVVRSHSYGVNTAFGVEVSLAFTDIARDFYLEDVLLMQDVMLADKPWIEVYTCEVLTTEITRDEDTRDYVITFRILK